MSITPCQEPPRIDKWLWAVRVYKTRSLAAKACQAGHVKIDGERVKPARHVHIGEIIEAKVGPITRTLRVVGYVEQRVGAKRVPEFAEDLTPPEEYEKLRRPQTGPVIKFDKEAGRPSKRDRRRLRRLKGKF